VQKWRAAAVRQVSLLAMIGAVLCWGTGPVMSKSALSFSGPISLLLIQLAASLVFLLLAIVIRGAMGDLKPSLLTPALTGILEPGLGYGLGNIGLATTTVSAATLLGPSEAAFTCLLGFIFFRRQPNLITLLSIAAISVGVALIVAPSLSSGHEVGSFVGNMFVLSGDVAAAVYITLCSKLMETKEPLVLAFAQILVAFTMTLLWWILRLIAGTETLHLLQVTPARAAYAAVSGVTEFGPPTWLFLVALRGLRANVVAVMMSLVPVLAICEAHLFLGEIMAPVQILGGAIILATMVVIKRGE
jgi:drug/metabolite transporter (DMT)-like permease